MTQIFVKKPREIIKNKKTIEKTLNARLSLKNRILDVEANPEDEFLAMQVIEAINLGFKVNDALLIKDEDFSFQKINIKDFTNKKDIREIRARIIGTKGKVLETLESLTDCLIVLHDNSVGIIGPKESAENASHAVKKIIHGSKHGNVYRYLEEQNVLEKQSF